jgi:hypothetical protein
MPFRLPASSLVEVFGLARRAEPAAYAPRRIPGIEPRGQRLALQDVRDRAGLRLVAIERPEELGFGQVAAIGRRDGLVVDPDLESVGLTDDREAPGEALAQRAHPLAEALPLDFAQHDLRTPRHGERFARQWFWVVWALFLHGLVNARHAHAKSVRVAVLGGLHLDDVGDGEQ